MTMSCGCDDAEVSVQCWPQRLLQCLIVGQNPETLVFLSLNTD